MSRRPVAVLAALLLAGTALLTACGPVGDHGSGAGSRPDASIGAASDADSAQSADLQQKLDAAEAAAAQADADTAADNG
ncbi:hypothetical protein [Kitasatospora sp. NPDC093806]|uniref:hypothetical protein n=1 Tax=Kitasatospora sp. NPDC093806 TaxID=3155075 RepID=UPI00341E43F7